MAVLSYTNAFPGIPMPQHSAGKSTVQNYLFPGAVAPGGTSSVLTPSNAFPGIPFAQHTVGATATVRNLICPGALQPLQQIIAAFTLMPQIVT
jgi:hypothetical protein